jgi:hypothetical protein
MEKAFVPEEQQRKSFPVSDFIFDFNTPSVQTSGADVGVSFISNNKILGTLPGNGIGHELVTMKPCSIVQPHIHPRASESTFLINGAFLRSIYSILS